MKVSPIPSSTEPVQDLLSNLRGDRTQWNDGRAIGAGPSSQPMITLLNDLKNAALTLWNSGTTAQRPVDPVLSQIYYDTDVGGFVFASAIRAGAVPAVWTPLGSGGGLSSPLTTKGDVWGYTSTDARVPIKANGLVATADSSKAAGWDWESVPTSGTLQSQAFTASGTFNVPTGVTLVWARMIGGGGGGSTTIVAATGGGGGGCGEEVDNLAIPCTSAGTITVTIGAAGIGGAAAQGSAQAGVAGGDTSLLSNSLTYFARGGGGGLTTGVGGIGGGPRGATGASTTVAGSMGTQESPNYFGGAGGGGGGNTTGTPGSGGSFNAGYPTRSAGGATAGAQAGGGGGANSPWGLGGDGGAGGAIGTAAASTCYGAGGGGGGGKATTTIGGGNGCAGYVLIQWVA